MFNKAASVFILAFILNWAWEISHSALYVNYQRGPITPFILFKAALVDAGIILFLIYIAQQLKPNQVIVFIGGLLIAAVIEMWALSTSRWTYHSLMPIVPILNIGLTPFIQLAITGCIVQAIFFQEKRGQ